MGGDGGWWWLMLSEGYVVPDSSFMSRRFVVPFVVQIVPAFERTLNGTGGSTTSQDENAGDEVRS